MDITPYVESFRRDLATAADAAGPEGRAAAERMLLALEPAFRLTAMELLSQAAAEITAELPAGVVEMRLRGRDPEVVVDVPAGPPEPPRPPAAPPTTDADDTEDGDVVARVTLRIPESVKVRAEELAAKGGYSLNSWIVTVLRAATSPRAMNVDIDLSSIPFLDQQGGHGRGGSRRMTGWI
jgi:hypothetical protein